MNNKILTINNKEEIFARFNQLNLLICDYSFANLYLFRHKYQYQQISDNGLFIEGISSDQCRFLMPTTEMALDNLENIKKLLSDYDFLYPIPEQWLSKFDPDQFHFQFRQSDSDYLYGAPKLATYPGRKLAAKRNLLKQFLNEYQAHSFFLEAEHIIQAKQLLEVWKNQKINIIHSDYEPCLEALEYLHELNLFGKIYYANDKPVGLVIAEKPNSKMVIMHFLKADMQLKGVYQYILHEFAANLENDLYINMEQDLGIEGLRQSKLSYQPDEIVKKWRVAIKK